MLRAALVEEAPRALSFLGNIGYRVIDAGYYYVDFRSEAGYLLVWLNPQPGHELHNVDIRVGPRSAAADKSSQMHHGTSLFKLAKHRCPSMKFEDGRRYSRLAFPANHATDWRGDLRESLERLSHILESEFCDVLRNEGGVLERLASERARGQEEGLAELLLSQTRPKARAAFEAGDWERVIALYEPLRKHLKRHELMRIDYARRKLREGS